MENTKDKILIVEDDFANGIVALKAMDELGFDAVLCSNAEDGAKELDKDDFLIVLTDMNMPLKKGSLADKKAGEIVVKECIKRHVPSVVVTGGTHHHGKKCVRILCPTSLIHLAKNKKLCLEDVVSVNEDEKSVSTWKTAYYYLKQFNIVNMLKSRKSYREHVGKIYHSGSE